MNISEINLLIEESSRFINTSIVVIDRDYAGKKVVKNYKLIDVKRIGFGKIKNLDAEPDPNDMWYTANAILQGDVDNDELDIIPLNWVIEAIKAGKPLFRNFFENEFPRR